MSLRRVSTTSSSTLLLHPLDIRFLGEPYGVPQSDASKGCSQQIVSPSQYPYVCPSWNQSSTPVTSTLSPADPSEGQDTTKPLAHSSSTGHIYWSSDASQDTASPTSPSEPTRPTAPTPLLHQATSLPKMQVCGREGVWWAVNASVLMLYRDLHARGRCSSVRAEVVPLHKVS
ncbi:uncharacterized protein [Cherax quadricarinatus]|uniref:uncharacterized protein n=1 Tax=Cherax quadricarinatus TaxID=27406 RepID=UPI00387E46C0